MFSMDELVFVDEVSGLIVIVEPGKFFDCLKIERLGESMVVGRDFFFDKDGEYDGAGSSVRQ